MNLYKYILILVSLKGLILHGQDLEKIGKKDMLKISGGLNFSNIFYNADGIQNRRQPYTYFLSGNISANFLGISLPYTFNFSNNQLGYTQPSNIQSFNPTYKWIKGYAGITSMNFSPYTLSNHLFTGAGVELTPKNFKFAMLYGRFKKAVEYDFENSSDINMSYKRMGWGASAQYEKNGHGIKLNYFSAKDDPHSLLFIPINTNVTPMENTAISVGGKTTLFKKITLEGEYALSGLTRNLSSPQDINVATANRLPLIFSTNATSQFFNAYKASIGYKEKIFGVNFNYERIDPDYKTLGAYYFNNDFENFTIAPSISLLKGKLNLNANTGLQRNNLNKDKLNTTNRWVGSINVSYAASKHLNLNGSFSNFSSFTKQRPQTDPFYRNTLDTLNFFQIAQSSMLSAMYNFGTATIKQSITAMGNYQVTGQKQGNIRDPGLFGSSNNTKVPTNIINSNVAYSVLFQPTKLTLTTAFNINKSVMEELTSIYLGPTLNVSRAFFKNLIKLSAGTTYNQALINNVKTNEIFNHRLTAGYSPKFSNDKVGKMSFSFAATYLQKLKTTNNSLSFNEFTGTLSLNYNF